MLSTSNTDNLKCVPNKVTVTSMYTNAKLRAIIAHRPRDINHISYDTLLAIIEAFLFNPAYMSPDDRYCVCCNAVMSKKNWTNHSRGRNHSKAQGMWEMKMQKIIDILERDAPSETPSLDS